MRKIKLKKKKDKNHNVIILLIVMIIITLFIVFNFIGKKLTPIIMNYAEKQAKKIAASAAIFHLFSSHFQKKKHSSCF